MKLTSAMRENCEFWGNWFKLSSINFPKRQTESLNEVNQILKVQIKANAIFYIYNFKL